jgi:Fic family protein
MDLVEPADAWTDTAAFNAADPSEVDRAADFPAQPDSSLWPPLEYEEVVWDIHPVTGMDRRDQRNIGRAYLASIPAKIADRDLRLSGPIAATAEDAAGAITAFDTEVGHEIAPFTSVLLMTESAASSQIEQLSASARKIAEAEVNGTGTEHAQMIVANVRAMEAALNLADDLSGESVLKMHEALMGETDPEDAGRWRDDQVWIGGPRRFGAGSPHDADFVPPLATRVPAAIDDMIAFARRRDLPAVPQIAVAHAQFETIHPFPDGNGRTGRALMHSMLRRNGLARNVSIPISSGLLTDTNGYYDALTAYREGDVEEIVSTVARAALIGIENGRGLLRDLATVREHWDDKLSGLRSDAGARRLADALLRSPVVSAPMVREMLHIEKNEHRHIEALVERGVLKRHQNHKSRNVTWRAQDVLDALDAYAERAGRRRPA